MSKEISHYGIPRRSGRYPWGSGKDPEQRNKSFLGYIDDLKKKGLSEVEIAKGMGITTTQLRAKKSIAKAEQRKSDAAQALRLYNKGMSKVEIGKRMGINESSVRSLLDPAIQRRADVTSATANMLKESVAKKGYIDIGAGVENHIGVSRTKLKTSVAMLQEEGYLVSYLQVDQLGTGKKTTVMVLSKPKKEEAVEAVKLKNRGLSEKEIAKEMGLKETEVRSVLKEVHSDVFKNKANVKMITDHSNDGGETFLGLKPIQSVSSKRVQIRYADKDDPDNDGASKDGVIELRRGVDDISLGNSKYAQVRIGVDGKYYMKGMAIYADDMPKGIDIIYNTNKAKGIPKEKVFKEMKTDKDGNIDPDNPFGATIKAGGQRGALNIVYEEGDWGRWSKTLSSQVLSKQSPSLAKKQLELAYKVKKEEFDEIMSLTNPAVRKKLLDAFADDADSSAVHLKAAALPRQSSHAILPFPKMKDTEIYAPNYRDGESVVLVRFPHGGTFEIPELRVNNRNSAAKKVMGNAKDAVGISPKVAERLSGADFDGDTVLVIPNPRGAIKSTSPLKGLANFDPKEAYPAHEGMPKMSSRTKGMQMGLVSNLITDMTVKGAPPEEIARAVRHSMVVIDAEKHHLNYKQSYKDNGIADLNLKYQGKSGGGAATLISRSSSEARPGARKLKVDPKTGKKVYEYTEETYTNKAGKTVKKTVSSTKMYETEDAFKLSSGTPMETVYATHANKLKALGNQARKESLLTPRVQSSPSARKTYSAEVDSLKASLNLALKNKPLERQAQLLANTVVSAKKRANPEMDASDIKKLKGQALTAARIRTGAKKQDIKISEREWEAIQAGAISNNTLIQILNNTDLDRVKQLATPRTSVMMSPSKLSRARVWLEAGHTQSEVADMLGVSTTVLSKSLE